LPRQTYLSQRRGFLATRPDGLGELLEEADMRVRIPLRGRAESLNLATAASICLYESAKAQEHS